MRHCKCFFRVSSVAGIKMKKENGYNLSNIFALSSKMLTFLNIRLKALFYDVDLNKISQLGIKQKRKLVLNESQLR